MLSDKHVSFQQFLDIIIFRHICRTPIKENFKKIQHLFLQVQQNTRLKNIKIE
jgi:hypothetical protein